MKKPFLLEKYRLRLILCLLVTSFVAGILIGNVLKDTLVKSGGILNPELLYELKYAAIDKKAFFFYVLRERLLIFLILIVLSTTWLGMVATYTCCVWMGISFGMLCAASVLQYGLKGIFLIMAGVFRRDLSICRCPSCFWNGAGNCAGRYIIRRNTPVTETGKSGKKRCSTWQGLPLLRQGACWKAT